jgi:hypothetical protein
MCGESWCTIVYGWQHMNHSKSDVVTIGSWDKIIGLNDQTWINRTYLFHVLQCGANALEGSDSMQLKQKKKANYLD